MRGTSAVLRGNLRLLGSCGALAGEFIQPIQDAFVNQERDANPCGVSASRAEVMPGCVGQPPVPRGPLVVVGMNLEMLRSLDEALTAGERDRVFRQRVLVVEPSLDVVADVLGRVDLSIELKRAERFRFFVGDAAGELLERWIEERIDDALPIEAVCWRAEGCSGLADEIRAMLSRMSDRQKSIQRELVSATELSADDAASGPLRAREALRDGAEGRRSLRVLLCGSRYTTYVRHALDGLGEALRGLGHRAETLLERDESSTLTTLAYRRAVLELRPDLIITANYPRALLGAALPGHIPHVCWIQDSMPHLLDERIGRSVGETELFIGNTLPELAEAYGYPKHALVSSSVPASEVRFHAGEISDADRVRFACDVAFVSHHSETPEAMRDRLMRELGPIGQTRPIVGALWESMPGLLRGAARESLGEGIDLAVRDCVLRVTGERASAAQLSMIKHRLALPLLGRLFRHEALRWASAICGRRGWSFRIHGNGWERVPGLARHAAGPIEHGESLRGCYHAARVHLHVDPSTLTHQRVYECAMSGGLPIVRFHADAMMTLLFTAADEARELGGRQWSDAPLGLRYLQACEGLGIQPAAFGAAVESAPRIGEKGRDAMVRVFDPHWLLDGLADVSFHDEPTLEQVLERAIEDRGWRASRSGAMRSRMIDCVGMRAFARRLIDSAWAIIGWRSACLRDGYGWPPRANWAEGRPGSATETGVGDAA